MKKNDLRLLEKVFVNEIVSEYPFQSKSKQYELLEEEGYVIRTFAVLPGRLPVKVSGWNLTAYGHIIYCRSCSELGETY
ncbi:MAG: hypothetical protein M3Q64_01805 [bacterium]|nr:hypothetical protein [bacterium]